MIEVLQPTKMSASMYTTFNKMIEEALTHVIDNTILILSEKYKFDAAEATIAVGILNTQENVLTKSKNETTAKKMEKKIVADINNNTEYGTKIKKDFASMFEKKIVCAKRIGEKKHYDMEFLLDDGSKYRCEVKSSITKKPSEWKTPWAHAGQFLNGTGEQWRIRKYYGSEWYKCLPIIKKDYNLQNDIPPFEEWWKNDASMGKVKTEFGKEFKDKVSAKQRKKIKAEFVKKLSIPHEVQDDLLEDYLRETKIVLDEKDCWLVVSSSYDDISFFKKVEYENIKKIERDEKSVDLVFKVESSKFKSIRVRWQNDNCIANISVQCT